MSTFLRRSWLTLRWVIAAFAILLVVMLWIPPVHSEAPADRIARTKFNPRALSVLSFCLFLVAMGLPAGRRARNGTVVTLLLLTLLAWIFEDEVRVFLGSPFSD